MSDGSEKDDSLSFAWNLQTQSGICLACCAGPGSGPGPGMSHQGECFGFLSCSRFTFHIRQYTSTTAQWSMQFVMDALGMIKRILQCKEFNKCYPNYSLLSDWDLLEEAFHTLKTSDVEYHPEHVHGHQDKTIPFSQLSNHTKQNILADEDTRLFQEHYASPNPQSPLMPSVTAQLHIQGRTVTGHFRQRIQDAASIPPYFEYLRYHNK